MLQPYSVSVLSPYPTTITTTKTHPPPEPETSRRVQFGALAEKHEKRGRVVDRCLLLNLLQL
jgi:hypothetical protein